MNNILYISSLTLMSTVILFSNLLGRAGAAVLAFSRFAVAYLFSARLFYKTPRITNFYGSEQLLLQGGVVKLVWRTKYVAFVHIKGVGYFLNRSEVALPINFTTQSFTLTAYSFLRRKRRTIKLRAMEMPVAPQPLLINRSPSIQGFTNGTFAPKSYQYQFNDSIITIKRTIKTISIPD